MKRLILILAFSVAIGCAKVPPNLDPAAVPIWKANEVLVALGTLQHASIELNKQQVCPTASTCRPLLSTPNKNIVVDAVVDTLKVMGPTAPVAWQGAVKRTLDVIESRLDAAGKTTLLPYIQAIKVIAGFLPALNTGGTDASSDSRVAQWGHPARLEGDLRLASAQ